MSRVGHAEQAVTNSEELERLYQNVLTLLQQSLLTSSTQRMQAQAADRSSSPSEHPREVGSPNGHPGGGNGIGNGNAGGASGQSPASGGNSPRRPPNLHNARDGHQLYTKLLLTLPALYSLRHDTLQALFCRCSDVELEAHLTSGLLGSNNNNNNPSNMNNGIPTEANA